MSHRELKQPKQVCPTCSKAVRHLAKHIAQKHRPNLDAAAGK